MANWGGCDINKPLVSIRCITYNHRKYISQALDSFLSQKTKFPYEIIVHDDASTDGTTEIISEYERKYPKIVKPIYEKENMYSKDWGYIENIINIHIKGKYTAICEGDDYWCDSLKLQKQVDFMESHSDCSLCTHNTLFHYSDGSKEDHNFNSWNYIRKLSLVDIFFGWNVHTSSYMIRSDMNYKPNFSKNFWSGDYVYITMAKYYGEVYSLPDVMSVYNANVATGVTVKNSQSSYEANINRLMARMEYLNQYNEYTEHKYKEIIEARKAEIVIKTSNDYEELKRAAKKMSSSPYFNEICRNVKAKELAKNIWKYKGYHMGRLWYLSVIGKHAKEKNKKKQPD